MREYAARRGWKITLQTNETGSGTPQRERREQLPEAARRREIDVVLALATGALMCAARGYSRRTEACEEFASAW
jgi:hypothetical protein